MSDLRYMSLIKPPTLLFFLPERDHLVQLPLNQSVPLVLVQPLPARKCLLNARERTIYYHLEGKRMLNE